nr:MAG: putative 13 kDa protein [Jiangsu sediment virgavirus]
MVRSNEIGARPNKYWPIVVGIVAIALFGFLTITNQKHATQSGDNIHKFANGGSFQDGNKRVHYNKNNQLAYNGSSSNSTFAKLFMCGLLVAAAAYCFWRWNRPSCSITCRGECGESGGLHS